VIHDRTGEKWFDFEGIAISDDLWLIPLPGHTPGHYGVAVKSDDGWLLHCGDAASPFHGPTDPNRPISKRPHRLVEKLIGPHVPRLRGFAQAHSDEVRLISGHDINSFREFVNEDTDH
jgi:glyoxylase-like metal-dependent hydrolase (beta-lactamase superfamily II)